MGRPRALGFFLACFYGYKVTGKMFQKFCLEFSNESLLVVRLRLEAAQKARAVYYTVCTVASEVCCVPSRKLGETPCLP